MTALLDQFGVPIPIETTAFGSMSSRTIGAWSKHMLKEIQKSSAFDNFIGVHLYDQFGFPVQYVREGKGNVIEIQTRENNA